MAYGSPEKPHIYDKSMFAGKDELEEERSE